MSALPRSIGSRLLPATLRPTATRAAAPRYRSYATEPTPKTSQEDAPGVKQAESTMIRQENPEEGTVRHKPDYNVIIDYRTS